MVTPPNATVTDAIWPFAENQIAAVRGLAARERHRSFEALNRQSQKADRTLRRGSADHGGDRRALRLVIRAGAQDYGGG